MPMLSGTFSAYQVASPWLMGNGNMTFSYRQSVGKRQGLPSSKDRVKTDNTAKPLDLRATANQLESFFWEMHVFTL